MAKDNGGSNIAFFLAGLGIGALLALLLAPRSGEETRGLLSRKADERRDYVAAKGKDLRRQAEELILNAKDLVSQEKDRLTAALDSREMVGDETTEDR